MEQCHSKKSGKSAVWVESVSVSADKSVMGLCGFCYYVLT